MIKQKILTAVVAVGLLTSLEYKSQAQPTQPTQSPSPSIQQNKTKLSPSDRKFVDEAAQGGMAEVQLGRLALKQAGSNTVKQYAQQMIDEHTKVNKELMALAKQKGVTPPKAIAPKYEKLRAKLSQLSGKNFDSTYMKEAGVKAHAEQAALFERQAQQGQDPQLKAFAAKTLPAVQKHLQEAQAFTGSTSPAMTPSPTPTPSITPSATPTPNQ